MRQRTRTPQAPTPSPAEAQSTRVDNGLKPYRALGVEDYERAWEAYTREPTVAGVQRAGYGQDTANRLVYEGLPRLGLEGLEKKLQKEARLVAARGERLSKGTEELSAESARKELELRRKEAERATREAAVVFGDTAEQAVEEARLIRANRRAAGALAKVNESLLTTAGTLAEYLEEALGEARKENLKGAEALKRVGLKPSGALDLVKSIATISTRIAQTSEAAIRMERLRLGEPTGILQVQGAEERRKPMSRTEATDKVNAAFRAFQRASQRAAIVDAELEEEGEEPHQLPQSTRVDSAKGGGHA